MITGKSDQTKEFSEIWLKSLKQKTTIIKRCQTDAKGNITWLNEEIRSDDDKSTLGYFANKIKSSIDELLCNCEKYSTSIVDRVLYKVHKEVNKVTKKHRDALHLYMFAKYYLQVKSCKIWPVPAKKVFFRTSGNFSPQIIFSERRASYHLIA